MQLAQAGAAPSVRKRLGAAVCLLLATGIPAPPARAVEGDTPAWRFEGSTLLYAERGRTDVLEPVGRLTRLFAGGQLLSLQLGVDAMTGASPTGAMPSTTVQTTTSASGRVSQTSVNELPTSAFHDVRGLVDVQGQTPIGSHLQIGGGTHFSRERDYRSRGRNGTVSLQLWQKLTTITGGFSRNDDDVFPVNGIPEGLSDGTGPPLAYSLPKRVESRLFGISQILSRRWMLALNTTRTNERGYLTEPYKVISVLGLDGTSTTELTENRPDTRQRTDALLSSVYHLTDDVLYLSYRYYWDSWGVRSHTLDFKIRHPLSDRRWLLPHVRIYGQTGADFYVHKLLEGDALPEFATSDTRLGPMRTITFGLTYGRPVLSTGGELRLRAEILHQWEGSHFVTTLASQGDPNLIPPLDTAALTVAYSVDF